MLVEELYLQLTKEKLCSIHWDEVLQRRDAPEFDRQWNRVYQELEALKATQGFSPEQQQSSDSWRQKGYLQVYRLCQNEEAAAYLSDDFGLLCDGELLGYQDTWLSGIKKLYQQGKVPCETISELF